MSERPQPQNPHEAQGSHQPLDEDSRAQAVDQQGRSDEWSDIANRLRREKQLNPQEINDGTPVNYDPDEPGKFSSTDSSSTPDMSEDFPSADSSSKPDAPKNGERTEPEPSTKLQKAGAFLGKAFSWRRKRRESNDDENQSTAAQDQDNTRPPKDKSKLQGAIDWATTSPHDRRDYATKPLTEKEIRKQKARDDKAAFRAEKRAEHAAEMTGRAEAHDRLGMLKVTHAEALRDKETFTRYGIRSEADQYGIPPESPLRGRSISDLATIKLAGEAVKNVEPDISDEDMILAVTKLVSQDVEGIEEVELRELYNLYEGNEPFSEFVDEEISKYFKLQEDINDMQQEITELEAKYPPKRSLKERVKDSVDRGLTHAYLKKYDIEQGDDTLHKGRVAGAIALGVVGLASLVFFKGSAEDVQDVAHQAAEQSAGMPPVPGSEIDPTVVAPETTTTTTVVTTTEATPTTTATPETTAAPSTTTETTASGTTTAEATTSTTASSETTTTGATSTTESSPNTGAPGDMDEGETPPTQTSETSGTQPPETPENGDAEGSNEGDADKEKKEGGQKPGTEAGPQHNLDVKFSPKASQLPEGGNIWESSEQFWIDAGAEGTPPNEMTQLTDALKDWRLEKMGISEAEARNLTVGTKLPMPNPEQLADIIKKSGVSF